MSKKIAIIHYTAPPTMGGVEAVIAAHADEMLRDGHQVTLIAGRQESQPGEKMPDAEVLLIPELDSKYAPFAQLNTALNAGTIPADFRSLTNDLTTRLAPVLQQYDVVFAHNVLTKHFNLPLTAALYALLDTGHIRRLINWCHDLTWGSKRAETRATVHPGYPWDLLRLFRPDVTYVSSSLHRLEQMVAELRYATADNQLTEKPITSDQIRVIPLGVHPDKLFRLPPASQHLIEQLDLWAADLIILMPIRISQAKNIGYGIDLVAELRQIDPALDVRLVVTGPPDPHNLQDQHELERLIEKRQALGLDRHVRFVFEQSDFPGDGLQIDLETVGDFYRLADVMFMPSRREGFGIPVIEAALSGVHIVTSDQVPAALEFGQNRVDTFPLYEAEDTDQMERRQLAQKIYRWHQTDVEHQLRRAARQEFLWPVIYQRHMKPLIL